MNYPDLRPIATRAIIYVDDLRLDYTVIAVSKGRLKSNVKITNDEYNHHGLTFTGDIVDPQLGRFTSWNDTMRALISWADRSGHTLEMYHISEDGKDRLDVNINSLV